MPERGTSLLLALLLAALLAACGDEAEPSAEVLTGSPTASTTTTPDLGPGTLVFLRDQADPSYLTGAIWLSELDGANARQVTPVGVTASYLGLGAAKSGSTLLYYATQDAGANTTVYSADLGTGESAVLLSYRDIPDYYSADISADGRYLVHTGPVSLDMYDFATGSSVTLFESGSGPDCLANVFEQCYRAIAPDWSPDGRLLKVVHSVYEGGWAEIVDPFVSPAAVLTAGGRAYPMNAAWSPGADALCAHGKALAEMSGLYLLESPDWEARNLFPGFEDYTVNPDSRQVVACDWLNQNEVAFVTMVERPQREGELLVYDRKTGQARLIVTLPEGTGCCGGVLVAVPGTSYAIAQVLQLERGSDFVMSRPSVVDARTGEIQRILETEDIILDVFSP